MTIDEFVSTHSPLFTKKQIVNHGIEIMEKFASYLTDVGSIEKPAKMESRTMLMFLAAKTAK